MVVSHGIVPVYRDVASDVQAQKRYTEVQRRRHANAHITDLSLEEKSSWTQKYIIK